MDQVSDNGIRERTSVITLELQRLAVQIDGLWQDSLTAGSGQAMALGEANQAVHRALLALSLQFASTSAGFVTDWA